MWGCALGPLEASALMATSPHKEERKKKDDGVVHNDEIPYQVKKGIGVSLQKIWKCHSIPISTKIRLMKALV